MLIFILSQFKLWEQILEVAHIEATSQDLFTYNLKIYEALETQKEC